MLSGSGSSISVLVAIAAGTAAVGNSDNSFALGVLIQALCLTAAACVLFVGADGCDPARISPRVLRKAAALCMVGSTVAALTVASLGVPHETSPESWITAGDACVPMCLTGVLHMVLEVLWPASAPAPQEQPSKRERICFACTVPLALALTVLASVTLLLGARVEIVGEPRTLVAGSPAAQVVRTAGWPHLPFPACRLAGFSLPGTLFDETSRELTIAPLNATAASSFTARAECDGFGNARFEPLAIGDVANPHPPRRRAAGWTWSRAQVLSLFLCGAALTSVLSTCLVLCGPTRSS